jgi:hypothetical protein
MEVEDESKDEQQVCETYCGCHQSVRTRKKLSNFNGTPETNNFVVWA